MTKDLWCGLRRNSVEESEGRDSVVKSEDEDSVVKSEMFAGTTASSISQT